MSEAHPVFPVLAIYSDGMTLYEMLDDFIVGRKSDLQAGDKGKYARSTIVDASGLAWRLLGAEKVSSFGAFFGFNIFLNQSIRVRLIFEGLATPANLEWLKSEVILRLNLKDRFGLVLRIGATTIDRVQATSLIGKVEAARSTHEVINVLLNAEFPERQRWTENPVR